MFIRQNSSQSKKNTSRKKKTSQTSNNSDSTKKDELKHGQKKGSETNKTSSGDNSWKDLVVTPEETQTIEAKLSQDSDEEEDGYRAFNRKVGSSVDMFELRFKQRGILISYAFLRGADYNFQSKQHTVMLYTALGDITITGECLGELKNRLRNRNIEWMQQFYDDVHELPKMGEPVIHSISEPVNQDS